MYDDEEDTTVRARACYQALLKCKKTQEIQPLDDEDDAQNIGLYNV